MAVSNNDCDEPNHGRATALSDKELERIFGRNSNPTKANCVSDTYTESTTNQKLDGPPLCRSLLLTSMSDVTAGKETPSQFTPADTKQPSVCHETVTMPVSLPVHFPPLPLKVPVHDSDSECSKTVPPYTGKVAIPRTPKRYAARYKDQFVAFLPVPKSKSNSNQSHSQVVKFYAGPNVSPVSPDSSNTPSPNYVSSAPSPSGSKIICNSSRMFPTFLNPSFSVPQVNTPLTTTDKSGTPQPVVSSSPPSACYFVTPATASAQNQLPIAKTFNTSNSTTNSWARLSDKLRRLKQTQHINSRNKFILPAPPKTSRTPSTPFLNTRQRRSPERLKTVNAIPRNPKL